MVARPRLRWLGAAVSGPRLCAGPGPVPRFARLCPVGPGWRKKGLACFAVGPGAPVLGARCPWPGSSLGFRPGPVALLRVALPRCLGLRVRSGSASLPPERTVALRPGALLRSVSGVPPDLPPVPVSPSGASREARGLRPGASPRPSGTPLLCLSLGCPAAVPGFPCFPCPALCAGGAAFSGSGPPAGLTFGPFCGTLSLRGPFRSFGGCPWV